MDYIIKQFNSGIHNVINEENIPSDAAIDSKNYITNNGKIFLVSGKKTIGVGDNDSSGAIYNLHYAYKTNGEKILYRNTGYKIQCLLNNTWADVITNIKPTDIYYFANYSSLSGSFVFINGDGGYWKINTANPTTALSMYDSAVNFYGKILIDSGRTILWNRKNGNSIDKTGIYGSKIEPINKSNYYTTVSNENIGAVGSMSYTGTLAFKSNVFRNCFAFTAKSTTAHGEEIFTDDFNGNLVSNFGGSGTINYCTGIFELNFKYITTSAVTASYMWENSNNGGITDFTYSTIRIPGEGFQFPQDEGGDEILNVVIGQDSAYYSIKKQSVYRLYIDQSDSFGANSSNKVWSKDTGVANCFGVASTSYGIVFINTANPNYPQLTVLHKNLTGDGLVQVNLLDHFDFSRYNFNDSIIETFGKYIVVACSKFGKSNDTLLMCDLKQKTVDIVGYGVKSFAKNDGKLYAGSPLTTAVYQLFDGNDDDGYSIDNYWVSKGEKYNTERLKKVKRLRMKGIISANQKVSIYMSYDDSSFELVGTIDGSKYNSSQSGNAIGCNIIGEEVVGGNYSDDNVSYFTDIKLKTPKFRKRNLKIIANGIGYFDISYIHDRDILLFENRIPKQFRKKKIN